MLGYLKNLEVQGKPEYIILESLGRLYAVLFHVVSKTVWPCPEAAMKLAGPVHAIAQATSGEALGLQDHHTGLSDLVGQSARFYSSQRIQETFSTRPGFTGRHGPGIGNIVGTSAPITFDGVGDRFGGQDGHPVVGRMRYNTRSRYQQEL